MTFEHFIITRFNLPIYKSTKAGEVSSTDEDYLTRRMDIFKTFCLPSIIQQSCQHFKWLVLFDKNTPMRIKEDITSIQSHYSRFIPCYFDLDNYPEVDTEYVELYYNYSSKLTAGEYDSIENNPEEYVRMMLVPMFVRDCIVSNLDGKPDYVITTRLDNDDALRKNFIEIIQRDAVKTGCFKLLDYIYGYRFNLPKREVCRFKYPSGHFTTLIEPLGKTLFTSQYWVHNVVDKVVPVKHIETIPLYVELIHETNVINSLKQPEWSDYKYALKHFRRKDFGYYNIRLCLISIISSLLRYAFSFTRNYLDCHLNKR